MAFSKPEVALRYVLEEKEIHAVVSNYEMPQMNGITLVKKIIEELPTTKMIVMSGHNTDYLLDKVLQAGIDENKIQLLDKANIINLCVLLNN